MKYWLHRISYEAEYSRPQLENGKLTIGFSRLSSQDFLAKAKSARSVGDLDSDVMKAYDQLLRSRHSLWRFLKEMQVGDLVIVPQVPQPGEYSVYVIRGGPKLLEGVDADLGFYRDVEVHKIGNKKTQGINRYKYADRALTARMKYYMANTDISDLRDNIEIALNAYKGGNPITLRSRTDDLAERLLVLIYCQLSPEKFESLLVWYFRRIGASDVRIPPKNERGRDGDADICASFDKVRLTIYVQAKFHDPKTATDDWPVQQVRKYEEWKKRGGAGEPDEHSDEDVHTSGLWVVSTCKCFTEACTKEAREHDVVLINGIQLAHMLLEAGLESLDV